MAYFNNFLVLVLWLLGSISGIDGTTYVEMSCDWTYYLNDMDGVGWIDLSTEFFNGMYSYHSNKNEDRRYKWRYCRPSSMVGSSASSIQSGNAIVLPFTTYDSEWQRGCGGNTALNYVYNEHSNHYEDRIFQFHCHALSSGYELTDCSWTSSYVNDYDGIVNYECDNNGFIRTIESIHSNHNEDRRFRFECCRVAYTESEIESSMVDMTCKTDSYYANDMDGGMNILESSYFLSGMYSYHSDQTEDRRFKFTYCKPQESSNPFISTIQLSQTNYDGEWGKSCSIYNGGNSAMVGVSSSHDNHYEDRLFTFTCGNLDTSRYGLTHCGWTGDLSNYDQVNDFNCPNNGIIRGIYSKHDNSKEDRIFRFECCSMSSNVFSNIVGSWESRIACQGCSSIEHSVQVGVSSSRTSSTTEEYRTELGLSITNGYEFTAYGASSTFSVTISSTQSEMTSNSLSETLDQSTVITQTITCEKTYLFQWIQQADDYIDGVGLSTVKIEGNNFKCTNNPYPICPLGFCATDDCDSCTNGYISP